MITATCFSSILRGAIIQLPRQGNKDSYHMYLQRLYPAPSPADPNPKHSEGDRSFISRLCENPLKTGRNPRVLLSTSLPHTHIPHTHIPHTHIPHTHSPYFIMIILFQLLNNRADWCICVFVPRDSVCACVCVCMRACVRVCVCGGGGRWVISLSFFLMVRFQNSH